jgi:hypothetical protein
MMFDGDPFLHPDIRIESYPNERTLVRRWPLSARKLNIVQKRVKSNLNNAANGMAIPLDATTLDR